MPGHGFWRIFHPAVAGNLSFVHGDQYNTWAGRIGRFLATPGKIGFAEKNPVFQRENASPASLLAATTDLRWSVVQA
jgi:hypothetical protein